MPTASRCLPVTAVAGIRSWQITIAAIWERLADEHGAATAYPTVRTYVSSHRDSGA
jgi:hypothetical protein